MRTFDILAKSTQYDYITALQDYSEKCYKPLADEAFKIY